MAGNKFTAARRKKVLEAIGRGASYTLAAKYAGISRQALYNWLKKGEEGASKEYVDFYKKFNEVEGEASVRWLSVIDEAMQEGDWKAAAWKLERRYPDEYGRQRITIDAEVEQTIQVEWGDEG